MPNTYVNKVVKSNGDTIIDLTQDTVTSSDHIMSGYTGHLASGAQVTGTGVGGTQSDWAQNDSTALDYVKNRVCYSEDPVYTTLFQHTETLSGGTQIFGDWTTQTTVTFADGNPYTLSLDGDTYTGTIFLDPSYAWVAGNFHIINSEADDTGEPFCITFSTNDGQYGGTSGNWAVFLAEAYTGTISLEFDIGEVAIHTLDDKYLNGALLKRGAGDYSVLLNGDDNYANLSADGSFAVAQGMGTSASGQASHAEGMNSSASEAGSHAEGTDTISSGSYSHAEGQGTIANHRSQHASGEYNIADPSQNASYTRGTYVEIVGNGSYSTRSNARTLDWNGNEVLAGKLTVGAAPTANMDVATKQYVDNAVAGGGGSSASNNPTLETEWVDVYSDWAAGYYYDPDNNYAYTQIPSTEMIWGSQTARTNTSCTPYSNLVPVKAGEEYRYQNTPIHFDSKNAEMPSIIIFDSTKSEVEAYTRTYQDEWTEFTIPANGAWMAVLYYNDQTYYLQKKEVAEDKFDILADVYANYRTYVNTAPPVLNTPTKGYICMGTDDLRRDQTKSLHELYTNANIPYFIAAIPENVKKCITDDPYKTNLDYMRLCVTAGGEIISHNTDQITAQNVDDFDFISKYFRGNKKELEAYGFTVNGIHKAGGSGYISGRDKRIDSWATAYYEHGDLFGYAYPYLAEREILEYIGSTSRIDDIVEDVCVNHGFAFITTHELSNDTQTMFNYLMNKLGQYTRGTDYEFVTPSQLYALLMPSTPPSSGGGGAAVTYSLSMSSNIITLTGSNGSTSSVTLPVYAGGVT